jgi:hypothetical protein
MQATKNNDQNGSLRLPSEQTKAIALREETIERLDLLREEDQTYDELVAELIDIYLTMERSMARGGDVL